MSPAKAMTKQRNDGIDFIRGLSVISVILLHINIRIPLDQSWIGNLAPQKIINILCKSGSYGVMVFFVVSGFLITMTSIQRWGTLSNIQFNQFFRIRFARIAPCLIALLAILSALHIAGVNGFIIKNTTLNQALFSAFTFHVNWLEAKVGYLPGAWDVLWSLSIEEVFYLFFPFICLFTRNEHVFKFAMIIFVILGPFARCMFGDNEMWSDRSYLSCMDGIAIGCIAAIFANKYTFNSKQLTRLLTIGLTTFFLVFLFRKQVYELGLTQIGINVTLLEIGIGLILIWCHHFYLLQKNIGRKITAVFRFYGKNSYEIYLTHMFVVLFMVEIFSHLALSENIVPLWYLIILITSAVLGDLIARYFSEPLNNLLKFSTSQRNILNTQEEVRS